MPPLADGRRMCARCSRPVVDLRGLTLDEITLVHLMSEERVCGLYSPEQFQPAQPAPRRVRSPLVTLALGASLLAARAQAQSGPHVHCQWNAASATETHPTSQADAASGYDTIQIQGRVMDAAGRPLQYASVCVEGQARTFTDSTGRFVLRVWARWGQRVPVRVAFLSETRTLHARVTGTRIEIKTPVLDGGVIVERTLIPSREANQPRRRGFSVATIIVPDP